MDLHRLSRDEITALYAQFGLPPISGGSGEGDDGDPSGDDDGAGETGKPGDDGAGDAGFKAITTQAEFDRMVEARIKRAAAKAAKDAEAAARTKFEDEAKAARDAEAGNFKALYEAEQQKREEAEKAIAARDLADRRRTAAKKHHVPDELADRIVGTTDEELEADAKKIAASLKKQGIDTDAGKGGGKPPTGKQAQTSFRFGSGPVVPWPGGAAKQEQ